MNTILVDTDVRGYVYFRYQVIWLGLVIDGKVVDSE
jgi:hypothetical protein